MPIGVLSSYKLFPYKAFTLTERLGGDILLTSVGRLSFKQTNHSS